VKPLSELVEDVLADRIELATWADGLDWSQAATLEPRVDAELARLPVPIAPAADGPLIRRRRALERLAGWLRSRRGDCGLLVAAERIVWLRGGSHVAYLAVLGRAGREAEAASLARTLLARPDCPGREQIEEFLGALSHPPEGWSDAVAAFAASPSLAGWEALWLFTPDDVLYERKRHTLDLMRRLDVDPELLFRCATHGGITADAVALVERGEVDPRLVEERGAESTAEGRPLWLGLAARAACVRGDRLGTVRLLKAALADAQPGFEPTADVEFVRAHADRELKDMLDAAGIPEEG
jgi:hypothetical protein